VQTILFFRSEKNSPKRHRRNNRFALFTARSGLRIKDICGATFSHETERHFAKIVFGSLKDIFLVFCFL